MSNVARNRNALLLLAYEREVYEWSNDTGKVVMSQLFTEVKTEQTNARKQAPRDAGRCRPGRQKSLKIRERLSRVSNICATRAWQPRVCTRVGAGRALLK